ncbi:arrestin domain-containing protein 3 [Austrofundulus limnaeus]|uniref:Arrestin domain-containing protein 3 n=1 Tax=Austrofundulus limnaeus TaxID=52670 RepID=A0A2I4BJN6_AUSLI|nr:PREDICTED: arrestin domain-containing protein 3-like [Austrofundulus limnaeus]
MSPIENLTLTCDREGAFSEGDIIAGMVSFNLKKDTKVKRVFVKAKGDAHVHWTEGSGDDEKSYSAHRRYFKEKVFLVAESENGNVLPKGINQFKFSLTIPQGSMPSSFKGVHGRIVYMLQAKISRKWRWTSTVTKEIDFFSKSIRNINRTVTPQSGLVNKKVGVFSKGDVHLSASVNRDVCSPGGTISAFAKICNSSSKSMKPKFSVVQRTVYRAEGSTNTSSNVLFKSVGDTIGPNSEATATCNIEIPTSVIYSIDNCDIISVDHLVKVYLDISFRFDPEVVFPLLMVPPNWTFPCEEAGPYPAGAFGGQSYSDFPAPLYPNPFPTGSDAYQYSTPEKTHQTNLASGSEWPQDAPPYGFSATGYTPSSIQHPAVPNNQQPEEQPPSYVSLFPPPGQ